MDNLDYFILFRRIILNRKDELKNTHSLYILTILRYYKHCTVVCIAFTLKRLKRATPNKTIYSCLKRLIDSGYARQSAGKGTIFYITPAGEQALKDFNESVKHTNYSSYNKKPPISKKVKRPGL